ncbi:MAG: hypothetical protein RLZ10_411 [Bacteroidota bacterium]|jgi:CBS domain-containing protein
MKNHLIDSNATIQEAIKRLDNLAVDALLFVVDGDNKLLGSITDGDVRRGLIHGIQINSRVLERKNIVRKTIK